MVEGLAVEVERLTKHFGSVHAVENLSFTVSPGRVTGFLGPNGAGKTTTLRILLGLVAATSGTATIGGRRYIDLPDPLLTVGAALEATGFHAGRSARDHLRVLATASGLPQRRADEVLAMVGLPDSAARRVGGFSLGMRQRLALAAALLGDPPVLLFDEPANGLDPEGIVWLRNYLRFLASEGRTVLVSSHVLSEVEQTVDDVLIIARGRLVRAAPLADLEGERSTLVTSPTPERLAAELTTAGLAGEPVGDGELRVRGALPAQVGALAFRAGVELHGLRQEENDLESVFLSLTGGNGAPPGPGGPAPWGPPDLAGLAVPAGSAGSAGSAGPAAPASPAAGTSTPEVSR